MKKENILTCLIGLYCCATGYSVCPEMASLMSVAAPAGIGGRSPGGRIPEQGGLNGGTSYWSFYLSLRH